MFRKLPNYFKRYYKGAKSFFNYRFVQASNSGNALGAAFLGRMYLEGVGVQASNLTAFKLFKLAADQGNAIGQAGMGVMYLEGRATQINPRTAVKYFQASADQG